MRRLAATVLILLVAAPAAPAATERRTTLQEVEREVMCVTCGVPLQVAESPAADAQRREIARLVDAGLTRRQVEDRLVAIYGERVLATPRDRGLTATAVALPAAIVLLAAILVAAAARRWRRRDRPTADAGPAAAAGGPDLDPSQARRVAEDLARYER